MRDNWTGRVGDYLDRRKYLYALTASSISAVLVFAPNIPHITNYVAALAGVDGLTEILEEQTREISELSDAVTDVAAALSDVGVVISSLSDQVSDLQIPSDILEIAPRSAPVNGYCISGEDCVISLFQRRVSGAEDCHLIPGQTVYYFHNPRTQSIHYTARLDKMPARDLGLNWSVIDVEISVPSGLEPDAELCVVPAYLGCPGQRSDAEPINEANPECVSVPIRNR